MGAVISERFGDIVRSVTPDELAAAAKLDFKKQFFLVAGVPVVQTPPRQDTKNISTMYKDADECTGEFVHTVQEYTRKGGALGFFIAPQKTFVRTNAKSIDDYDGDVARVCDINRATITIENAAQYRKVTNLLLPANNRSVVRLQDGFASPDRDGGLRRVLANVAMSNGHITEIQVRHAAMEKAYERTAPLYKEIRFMRARLDAAEDDGSMSNQQIEALGKSLNHKEQRRLTLHEAAAKKMAGVVIERDFFLIDDFPVMQTFDRYSKEHSTVVPDVVSGNYVVDNRFLSMRSDPARHVQSISREVFLARSVAMVSSPGAKACLQVA